MPEKNDHSIEVVGIVSARNQEPYVQLKIGEGVLAQLTMSQARKIADDLYLSASRVEADAMLLRFWKDHDLPLEAAAVLLREFRDFRLGLDLNVPETYHREPTVEEEQE